MARKNSATPSFSHVQNIGIIGAGLMGLEIAALNVRNSFPVMIYDSNPEMLKTVRSRLSMELSDIEDEKVRDEMMSLIEIGTLEELGDCDLIIEAIIEKMEVKAELYQSMKPYLRANTIFTTNTSTIPIEKLSKVFPLPKNFAGFHFLHPVWNRELVEIIPSTQTSEGVLQRLSDYAISLEKTPLCVCDCPGFVVNRLLQPYLNEALSLLRIGVPMEQIEKAALQFGMTWGPLRIMDEIGLDTVMHAGKVLYEAYPERIELSPILVYMMKKKLLGRKSGAGFYLWGDDWRENVHNHAYQPGDFNPQVEKIVRDWQEGEPQKLSLAEIGNRLAMAMADEAQRILEDDVVSEQGQIDMAAVIGLAFPESKRGPLAWKARETSR
ncbi:MAG: 3-hydroxyacyl-CoA dehydrogenase family protein [Planctomycetia bacterium]|nr:3-hydroxyacyl-CoA dehydrogenase family protein [Planctomycetia bacterium]